MILNDRCNGGSCLRQGECELLIHRRLTAKALGGEALNEIQFGRGLVITGNHQILIGNSQHIHSISRSTAFQHYLPFLPIVAPLSQSIEDYSNQHDLTASFIQTQLPPNIELISLQFTLDGSVLLRLAHQYGITEHPLYSQSVTIDLAALFLKAVVNVTEMSLTANTKKQVQQGFNVTLAAMEVKTWILTF